MDAACHLQLGCSIAIKRTLVGVQHDATQAMARHDCATGDAGKACVFEQDLCAGWLILCVCLPSISAFGQQKYGIHGVCMWDWTTLLCGVAFAKKKFWQAAKGSSKTSLHNCATGDSDESNHDGPVAGPGCAVVCGRRHKLIVQRQGHVCATGDRVEVS
eukprot:scaffold167623_cov24-Tisochrysis_lutea.AAC.1